jgi:DNA-binding response OmpR family regulator
VTLPLTSHPLDVLLLDDGAASYKPVLAALRRAGHSVDTATDGAAAIQLIRRHPPSIVLVDAHMAGRSDWQLLNRLRDESPRAIVIAVGPSDQTLEVAALTRGADDYMRRPLRAPAVVARIGAHRRLLRRIGEQPAGEVYDDGLVRVDVAQRLVEVAGQEVSLTPLEFRLLTALIRCRDRVVTRDELQELAWYCAPDGAQEHVKLYVHYLRRKLADATSEDLIRTVRGFGYRWMGNGAV